MYPVITKILSLFQPRSCSCYYWCPRSSFISPYGVNETGDCPLWHIIPVQHNNGHIDCVCGATFKGIISCDDDCKIWSLFKHSSGMLHQTNIYKYNCYIFNWDFFHKVISPLCMSPSLKAINVFIFDYIS